MIVEGNDGRAMLSGEIDAAPAMVRGEVDDARAIFIVVTVSQYAVQLD